MTRDRWPGYAAVCLLCAFYAGVWYLARHPRVDGLYRSYFIDRTLRHWPGDPRLNYQLGTLIDFSKPHPYLARHGWSPPDQAGSWMIERVAHLFFAIDRAAAGRLELQFEATAFVPRRYPRTTVAIAVNGCVIGRRLFRENGRSQSVKLMLPQEVWSGSPVTGDRRLVRISFEVVHPGPPLRFSSAKDRRMLGLHLAWLCLTVYGGACHTVR